ncbi:MAG TPA: alpha/beta hydrolase [Stellaceae bacterium]|nr:alpha/beta hydrolase [Stellaceae bacterium]
MTYFLSFRTRNVGGAVADPVLLQGDGTAPSLALSIIPSAAVPAVVAGKNLLLGTHGFNVSMQRGAAQLGTLDRYLGLPPPNLFIAMLWPGDAWLPIVDYPFEGDVALDCGRRLAAFCESACHVARSLSFVSHSLGARLVLEAVADLARETQSVCVTAGAINGDCLTAEYADATANAARVSVLASRKDRVLKIAFRIGDPIADLLHDDHSPFQPALGYSGPVLPAPPSVLAPWQIGDADNYDHGSYLPTYPPQPLPPPPAAPWPKVADFMKRAFLGQTQTWP